MVAAGSTWSRRLGKRQPMDRIRVGLTGLGVVFLVTAAASLLFGPSQGEPAPATIAKPAGEPLAQLGVAPNSEKEAGANPVGPRPVKPATPPAGPIANEGSPASSPSAAWSGGGDRPVGV